MNKYSDLTLLQKLIRSAILLLCLATLLLTSLRVLGHGYFPSDDALRHVAKVVSGKEWHEILVIRPEITMDSHPGWHFILDLVGKTINYDKTLLLNFSVLSLFLLFTCTPFFLFKRPEAWAAALLIVTIFSPGIISRLFLGRPFIFSMFVVLMFCFLWEKIRDKSQPILEIVIYTLLAALSTWIHGTWYLLSLPLAALFLCKQWRVFLLMSAATIVGVFLGACFTGSPFTFLYQMAYHAIAAMGKHDFQRQLVTEFHPSTGDFPTLTVVGLLLIWRLARNQWAKDVVYNPVFTLAVLGWIMGLAIGRFWHDWAFPALIFWISNEIQTVIKANTRNFQLSRILLIIFLCLSFFLSGSSDFRNRWSRHQILWPDMNNPEHRPWLPDAGGILYNDNMILFYEVFYKNPNAPWRYILGFEPIWMPENHLKMYRKIQLTIGKDESYQPWINAMTTKDRIILIRNKKPETKGLEWHEITPNVWSGNKTTSP